MMQVELPSLFPEGTDETIANPLLQVVRQAYKDGLINTDHWDIRRQEEQKTWLHFRRRGAHLPSQGWKLHISADQSSAETILQRVLPFLLQEGATFKFASSLEHLRQLNRGEGGLSQIGKFMTIYPRNDEEAVALAGSLDKITWGFSGPAIPSDRMLRPNSLVFYRYGGYDNNIYTQELLGTVWPAISTPDNQLVPDKRPLKYEAPEGRIDPFIASEIACDLPSSERLLAERYLIVSAISASVNHTISLAIDLKSQQTCVIKSPGRSWQYTLPEYERKGFQREARILRELAGHPRIPVLFDLLEQEQSMYLVISDIPGQTLTDRLLKQIPFSLFPFQQIIAWIRELAEILAFVHQKGLVYADLKPTNVIVGPDEKLYLIDFEFADRQGAPGKARTGTQGYMSPQQYDGQPRAVTDDIYSLGALLYLLVTAAEPSTAPDTLALLKRPVELLRPDVPFALNEIIVRCLHPEPEMRYASMTEVIAALDRVSFNEQSSQARSENSSSPLNANENQLRSRNVARKLLRTLCTTAQPIEDGEGHQGLTWKTSHPLAHNYALRDLNAGLAGTILALAGLTAELDEPDAYNILAKGAYHLCKTRPHSEPPLPGLYAGEAGVGAALLLAGQILADHALIAAAIERGMSVSAQPHTTPDLMQGSAGRLLFHLLLWEGTQDEVHLNAARVCGEHLVKTARTNEDGEVSWLIPPGFGSLSGKYHLGYSHGAAGIADALIDLYEVTGDERFIPTIQGVAKWLQRRAIPVLADQSGLGWPGTEEEHLPSTPLWCHGSTGIGRFYLHASQYSWLPGALDIARRAAQAVIHLARAEGPVLCHGLAGSIEFLLDMYQQTGELSYLAEAQAFGELLEAFGVEQEGRLVFHSDVHNVFSPDYHIGYAGIAISFLRLSAPERIPYQLSRAGFQAYQSRAREKVSFAHSA